MNGVFIVHGNSDTDDICQLYAWKNLDAIISPPIRRISVGDPLTVEFKRVRIVSNKFDMFGKSEVMIVNHVKNRATKDRAMQQITYYDDSADTKRIAKSKGIGGKKSYTVDVFEADEYGCPIVIHLPGYESTIIDITTQFWEIDDTHMIADITGLIQKGLSLIGAAVPGYGAYFTIASGIAGVGSRIIASAIQHRELAPDHTLQLRMDDAKKPLYVGIYICVPGTDINEMDVIARDYIVRDYQLLRKNASTGLWVEYEGTYFVLNISNDKRADLADFDYTASASDILSKLYNPSTDNTQALHADIVNLASDSYKLGLLKILQQKYATYVATPETSADRAGQLAVLKALYNQIPKDEVDWFNSTVPQIAALFN